MIHAIKADQIHVVEYLLQAGAEINANRIFYAANHDRIIDLFIKHGYTDYNIIMQTAAAVGNVGLVKAMLNKGANNFNGCMDNAAGAGYLEIVNIMLEKGADNFHECMLSAAISGCLDIVKIMKAKGANNFNQCLKYWADHHGESYYSCDTAEFLLDCGATNIEKCINILQEHHDYEKVNWLKSKQN